MPIHAQTGAYSGNWTVLDLIKGTRRNGPIFLATKDLFWFTVYYSIYIRQIT